MSRTMKRRQKKDVTTVFTSHYKETSIVLSALDYVSCKNKVKVTDTVQEFTSSMYSNFLVQSPSDFYL